MANKLVVIINNLKIPKIKKILLYEIKFLVPNYSCLQNPSLGSYRPQISVLSVLCPQLNLLTPPRKKIPGYATAPIYNGQNQHLHKIQSRNFGHKITFNLSHMRDTHFLCTIQLTVTSVIWAELCWTEKRMFDVSDQLNAQILVL